MHLDQARVLCERRSKWHIHAGSSWFDFVCNICYLLFHWSASSAGPVPALRLRVHKPRDRGRIRACKLSRLENCATLCDISYRKMQWTWLRLRSHCTVIGLAFWNWFGDAPWGSHRRSGQKRTHNEGAMGKEPRQSYSPSKRNPCLIMLDCKILKAARRSKASRESESQCCTREPFWHWDVWTCGTTREDGCRAKHVCMDSWWFLNFQWNCSSCVKLQTKKWIGDCLTICWESLMAEYTSLGWQWIGKEHLDVQAFWVQVTTLLILLCRLCRHVMMICVNCRLCRLC